MTKYLFFWRTIKELEQYAKELSAFATTIARERSEDHTKFKKEINYLESEVVRLKTALEIIAKRQIDNYSYLTAKDALDNVGNS